MENAILGEYITCSPTITYYHREGIEILVFQKGRVSVSETAGMEVVAGCGGQLSEVPDGGQL